VNALLSVRPEFVTRILDGTKKYEYRKKVFIRKDIDRVIIYASSPLKRIVGEFKFDEIIADTPDLIWEKTAFDSGINKDIFFRYFYGIEKAYAIRIKHVIKYQNPLHLENLYPGIIPPQSFCYLPQINTLLHNGS